MELSKYIKRVVLDNKTLAVVLLSLSFATSFIHHYVQKSVYISDFQITNGEIEYSNFKSLNDFKNIDSNYYEFENGGELKEIKDRLNPFNISYVQNGKVGINFKITTLTKDIDHHQVSIDILSLLNANKLIQDSQKKNIAVLDKKLNYLEHKIAYLDTIMNASTPPRSDMADLAGLSYDLFAQQIELELEKESLANFQLIKPVTKITENRRPIAVFIALYLFLAGIIFVFFSKKPKED